MTIREYRKKHRRCRTCKHAKDRGLFWICTAKNKYHDRSLSRMGLNGMFCPVYKAEEGDCNEV